MEKNSLEVDILGSSFTVQSSGDPEYLRRVAGYLKNKIQEIQQKYADNTTQDPIKISLLAGLNVVDELFRCQGRNAFPETADGEIEKITERLIDTIDRSLLGN
jgi:cell division protein ZapA (FtsZ GTPase activity inhibitor)